MRSSPPTLDPLTSTGLGAVVPLMTRLEEGRVGAAKVSYTARRVPLGRAVGLLGGALAPRSGDVLLARVTRVRQHTRLELTGGRRAHLHVGDEIVVCYGNRYAPDQFEAVVPSDLEPCHLVAAGGIAGRCLTRSSAIKPATEILPLGLLVDAAGRRLNLADWALPRAVLGATKPLTLAVVGTTMNAGKTTCAGHLVRGLAASGLRVGAAKLTGTGAGGDRWFLQDAGAQPVLDFTDAGVASTYRLSPSRVEEIASSLLGHLAREGVDAAVLEIADGLLQSETARLLESPGFVQHVDGIIFASGDAMGAAAGVLWLRERALPVLAISGALTQSPLAVREAETATNLPVLDMAALDEAEITARLAARLPARPTPRATAGIAG